MAKTKTPPAASSELLDKFKSLPPTPVTLQQADETGINPAAVSYDTQMLLAKILQTADQEQMAREPDVPDARMRATATLTPELDRLVRNYLHESRGKASPLIRLSLIHFINTFSVEEFSAISEQMRPKRK